MVCMYVQHININLGHYNYVLVYKNSYRIKRDLGTASRKSIETSNIQYFNTIDRAHCREVHSAFLIA